MGSYDSSAGPTVRGTSSFPSQRDSITAAGTEGLMERFKARMNALRDQGKWIGNVRVRHVLVVIS